MTGAPPRAFQVLTLSGGGYLGLYTATILAELEASLGGPLLSDCFDLIAGTSVGGILALGVALGVPAGQMAKAFEERGEAIFSSRRVPSSFFESCSDLLRMSFGPKYDGIALRETIAGLVGEHTLGDLRRPLVKSNALSTIVPLPIILVTAVPDGNRHIVLKGKDRIGPIPRDCSIRFEVENSDALPVGTTVEWMARNGGKEAELRNDMGHAGEPGYVWDDRSAYVGTHHMDVVFRRFGRLTGIKRVPVIISGVPVPPRNPPRAAWVRLRGRR